MRRVIASLLVSGAVVLAPVSASAASCPDGFHAHAVSDGDHEHAEHRHVGLNADDADRNGNGLICVKHIDQGGIHVHIDDSAP